MDFRKINNIINRIQPKTAELDTYQAMSLKYSNQYKP